MIKMMVSDMDGTLLSRGGTISPGNLKAIRDLEQKGIEFVIASGRDYGGVHFILDEYHLRCEAILGNGSQYVDRDGNVLLSCYMNKSVVKDVVTVFKSRGIPYMIFTTDGFYTGYEPSFVRDRFVSRSRNRFGGTGAEYEKDGRLAHMPCNHLQKIEDFDEFLRRDLEIIKVEAFSMAGYEIEDARKGLEKIPGISFLSSFDDNVEVTDKGAQKGYILEKIIGMRGLSKEEIMVAGDGMNDLSMFECFPNSYAPSNACDRIKELAGTIVCSNEEDGFAQAVREIWND